MSLVTRLGNYELIRLVARGGMADVYLARQRGVGQFERHVAVKVLNGAHSNDLEARALFLDEARLLAMLGHHNLASVFEVAIQDDVHYLAMEYVHGADLREVLNVAGKTGRAIPYEAATSIIASAAAGLDHAHRRCGPDGKPLHLVHRDVSLSNIMVGHDGNVKVVDFGIATATVSSVHTQPGVVRGKASYMSPEQCLGDDVDLRTDVFALGIVLYELTTGHRCFPGNNDFERMISVVRGDFVPPSVHIPSYPPALEAIVKIALSPVGSQAGLIGVLVAVAVVAAVNAGKNKATANRRFQLGRLEIVTRDRRNLAISARYKNVGEAIDFAFTELHERLRSAPRRDYDPFVLAATELTHTKKGQIGLADIEKIKVANCSLSIRKRGKKLAWASVHMKNLTNGMLFVEDLAERGIVVDAASGVFVPPTVLDKLRAATARQQALPQARIVQR